MDKNDYFEKVMMKLIFVLVFFKQTLLYNLYHTFFNIVLFNFYWLSETLSSLMFFDARVLVMNNLFIRFNATHEIFYFVK